MAQAVAKLKFWLGDFQATWLETSEDQVDDHFDLVTADSIDAYIVQDREKGIWLTTQAGSIAIRIESTLAPMGEGLSRRASAAEQLVE